MHAISPIKTGVTLGIVLGIWHLGWAAIVAAGWAQTVVDFLFRLHFVAPVLTIQPFDAKTAALLVAVTTAAGFVLGAIGAFAWNQLHRIEGRGR